MSEDELILTHILQCRRIDLHLDSPRLTKDQQEQFDSYKTRRASGEPLQYILGSCNFFGLEFKVDPRVLVPRPETEILVEETLRRFKGSTILDIGTGSGCIAVSLAKNLPTARVTAVDISPEALAVAKENAAAHNVADHIDFVQADIRSTAISGCFDMVVSNPPYIPSSQMASLPADVQKEPRLALDGGQDGLAFYKILIKSSPLLLRAGGCLMMEFGDACLAACLPAGRAGRDRVSQSEAIQSMLQQAGLFSHVEIIKDLTARERLFVAIIKE